MAGAELRDAGTAPEPFACRRVSPIMTLPVHSEADYRIAVLIPCYNEAVTIGEVVTDFRRALPDATIYVFDNNSVDDTAAIAHSVGADVRTVRQQGKGNVVRRMFADVEADLYVMVDGDGTYDADSAAAMVRKLIGEHADMVVGCRHTEERSAYRAGHRFGNRLLTGCVAMLFGRSFTDILSGYRVFSRRFVKSFPALAAGFEIETELTVHALELRMPIGEFDTPYRSRPAGSTSKLSTYRDGWRILMTILKLMKSERPLSFFGAVCALLLLLSVVLAAPIVQTWLTTGLVPRFPTAILATGLALLGFLSLACGLILDTVTRGRQELKRLAYLACAAPH